MLHFLSSNFKMITTEKFSHFPVFAAIDKNFLKSSQKKKKLANFRDENNILDKKLYNSHFTVNQISFFIPIT